MGAIIAVLIQQMPGIIEFAKAEFVKAHPGEPIPTNESIKAALAAAVISSLGVDSGWLAAHPE